MTEKEYQSTTPDHSSKEMDELIMAKRLRTLPVLIGSLLFVALSIFAGVMVGAVFFGICAAVFIWQMIYPLKGAGQALARRERRRQMTFEELLEAPGDFTYDADGFSLRYKGKQHYIAWKEICTIFGYKRDNYTTDCICMDVFCDRGIAFVLDEDVIGWYTFNRNLASAFPQTANWELEIMAPAFETMLRNIYDRDGRSMAEAQELAGSYKSGWVLE